MDNDLYVESLKQKIRDLEKENLRLSEYEQRYLILLDRAHVAYSLFDVESFELLEFNKYTHEFLGYDRNELKKLPFDEIMPMSEREKLSKMLTKRADYECRPGPNKRPKLSPRHFHGYYRSEKDAARPAGK